MFVCLWIGFVTNTKINADQGLAYYTSSHYSISDPAVIHLLPHFEHLISYLLLKGMANWKTLADVKSENMGYGEKPDYITAKVTILHCKKDNVLYQVWFLWVGVISNSKISLLYVFMTPK